MTIMQKGPSGENWESGFLVRRLDNSGWQDCVVYARNAAGTGWVLVYSPPSSAPGGPGGGIPP